MDFPFLNTKPQPSAPTLGEIFADLLRRNSELATENLKLRLELGTQRIDSKIEQHQAGFKSLQSLLRLLRGDDPEVLTALSTAIAPLDSYRMNRALQVGGFWIESMGDGWVRFTDLHGQTGCYEMSGAQFEAFKLELAKMTIPAPKPNFAFPKENIEPAVMAA